MGKWMYRTIHKYIVQAKCTSPLHIGSAEGDKGDVLVHPVTDRPFIQGTSLAGVLRTASMVIHGAEVTDRLFGASKVAEGANASSFASRVKISEGSFLMETVKMELRPRVAIDPKTGSVNASRNIVTDQSFGHKFEMESIGAGAVVRFEIVLFDDPEDSLKDSLEKIFAEMKAEHLQLGGQKSNGEGFLLLEKLWHCSFDMTIEADRMNWAEEATLSETAYEDISNDINSAQKSPVVYEIRVKGKTEGALLVKGIAVTEGFGEGIPDVKNMQNADGKYIIPGSALKGVLKNRMNMIAERMDVSEYIRKIFGDIGDKENKGCAGCIQVLDTEIGEKKKNDAVPMQHHVHIDKFTAGVMNGQLFTEQNAYGDVNMVIKVTKSAYADKAAGLLLMALRDLAIGMINIGSGYASGKGFIAVDTIEIEAVSSTDKAVISMGMENKAISDSCGIINRCLSALAKEKQ